MNILFIHEVDWLKKVALDFHNLAESLSILKHNIYTIDYEDTWKRKGNFDLGSFKTSKINDVHRVLPQASVNLRRPGFIKIPGISRFSAAITHYYEIQRVIREKQIDAIVLYSVPTNGLQAIHLARKFGIPILFRSIDILHALVRYPILRPPTKYMENKVYTRADATLAITPNHSKYVIKMGADPGKVKLLLLPIDTSVFNPSIDCADVRQQWALDEKDCVIVFIGTLYNFSGLDSFIHRFPQVIAAIPEAKFLIVGDGPQRPALEKIISDKGLQNKVIITGFQPYQTMPQYINSAKVCVNPFINTDATRDIFPGKIIQYLACGRATVATPLLGITSLIKGEPDGIAYDDNIDDIIGEVITLLKSEDRRHQMGQAGLNYVQQKHEQHKIAAQLEAELASVVEHSRIARGGNIN